jgi:secreted protein with Ig-like and vWFA domain
MDVSSIELHFNSGELDRMDVQAEVGGLQLQGSTLPEGSREQIMKAADRLLTLVTRQLKKGLREGLKE